MATKMTRADIGLLVGTGVRAASGDVEALTIEQIHIDVTGALLQIPVPEGAPANAVAAFQPTGRGTAAVAFDALDYSELGALSFDIEIDDPAVGLVGGFVVFNVPAPVVEPELVVAHG